MNSVLERTWQSLWHLKNTFIVQARVDESCTHFALLHAIRVFCAIPICTLQYKDKLITPFQLLTSRKPKLQHLRVLYCPCVVKKYSTTELTKSGHSTSINVVKNFTQRGVHGIYVGVGDLTSGHLIFLRQTSQTISSVDVIFDENFLSALSYKNCSYRAALLTRPIGPTPTTDRPTERKGDISQSIFSRPNQYTSPTTAIIEEENYDYENNSNDNIISNFYENMITSTSKDVHNIDNHTISTNNSKEEELFSLDNTLKTTHDSAPTNSLPRRSARICNNNFRISGKEWLNTVTENK